MKCADFDDMPRRDGTAAGGACGPIRVRVGHDPLTVRGKRRVAVTEVDPALRAAHLAALRSTRRAGSIGRRSRACEPRPAAPVVAPGVVRHHAMVEQQAQIRNRRHSAQYSRENIPAGPSQRCMNTNRSPRWRIDGVIDLVRRFPHFASGIDLQKVSQRHNELRAPRTEIEPPDPVPIRWLICGEIAHIHAVPVLGLDEREPPVVERQRNSAFRVNRLNRPGEVPLPPVQTDDPADQGPSMPSLKMTASTPSSACSHCAMLPCWKFQAALLASTLEAAAR